MESKEQATQALEQQLLKVRLLRKYAEPHRTPQDFVQLDGFYFDDGQADYVFQLDSDNDCIFAGQTTEIRASGPELAVRVLILDGTPPAIAVRLLRKLADWYERQPEIGQRDDQGANCPECHEPLGVNGVSCRLCADYMRLEQVF